MKKTKKCCGDPSSKCKNKCSCKSDPCDPCNSKRSEKSNSLQDQLIENLKKLISIYKS